MQQFVPASLSTIRHECPPASGSFYQLIDPALFVGRLLRAKHLVGRLLDMPQDALVDHLFMQQLAVEQSVFCELALIARCPVPPQEYLHALKALFDASRDDLPDTEELMKCQLIMQQVDEWTEGLQACMN